MKLGDKNIQFVFESTQSMSLKTQLGLLFFLAQIVSLNKYADSLTPFLKMAKYIRVLMSALLPYPKHTYMVHLVTKNPKQCRVKSGIFGQTAKFGQPPCLFHSSIIGIIMK